MISLVVAAVLLLIHALVCLMLWTLMKLGLLPVRGHMLAVMVLVPLWGPLLVVLLSVRSAVFGEGLKESALESLRFSDDLHRSLCDFARAPGVRELSDATRARLDRVLPALLQAAQGVPHGWTWAWWGLALACLVATAVLVWPARLLHKEELSTQASTA